MVPFKFWVLGGAAFNVVLSEPMLTRLCVSYPRAATNTSVIPSWTDPSLIYPS